jgi:hypothetical protein
VLYVAAEGEGGMGARLEALKAKLGDPGEGFAMILQPVTIGPPHAHLNDLIAACRLHRADLVIVDTVARTFGTGNEDAAQDMGAFIAAIDRVRSEGGLSPKAKPDAPPERLPHIAVVHHGSKDPAGKTPRGSGALLGAVELVVKVTKGADGAASLATVEAAKEEPEGTNLSFRLDVVELPAKSGGQLRRTCLAVGGSEQAGTFSARLPAQARRALMYLADVIGRGGNKLPPGDMFPPHADLRCVPMDLWRDECRVRSLAASDEKRAANSAFRRAAELLIDRGYVATAEHKGVRLAWIATAPGTAGT